MGIMQNWVENKREGNIDTFTRTSYDGVHFVIELDTSSDQARVTFPDLTGFHDFNHEIHPKQITFTGNKEDIIEGFLNGTISLDDYWVLRYLVVNNPKWNFI